MDIIKFNKTNDEEIIKSNDKNELLESIERSKTEMFFYRYVSKERVLALGGMIFVLYYVISLLFGSYSITMLAGLFYDKQQTERNVKRLESQNAELKRKVFEIKGLLPKE